MFDVCLFVRLHIDVAFEAFHGNSRLDLDGLQRKEGRGGKRSVGMRELAQTKVRILLSP